MNPDAPTPLDWLSHCKMTCVGGSERGECPCTHPRQCELRDHPDYAAKRREANIRMVNTCIPDPTPLAVAILEKAGLPVAEAILVATQKKPS